MDQLNPEMARLVAAKMERRHKLAALPYPEKVKAVVRLQQMAAPLLKKQGRLARVWTLESEGQ
jgi:hypothetical protein